MPEEIVVKLYEDGTLAIRQDHWDLLSAWLLKMGWSCGVVSDSLNATFGIQVPFDKTNPIFKVEPKIAWREFL